MLPDHLTLETARKHGAIEVTLDGEPVDMVIEANTAEGWLRRVRTDHNGHPIREGDELAIEFMRGRVTARLTRITVSDPRAGR